MSPQAFMKVDSEQVAKDAGLVMSDRNAPGITREKMEVASEDNEKTKIIWKYKLPSGDELKDEKRITFLNSLAVPPAWTDVWFCNDKKGHIQATGKDSNGRLQYRYHPTWNDYKSAIKYMNVDEFAIALNALRFEVEEDLKANKMYRDKVAAIVVKLIDRYHIRVGSDQYAQENESYGLTTIQKGHVELWEGKKALEGEIDAVLNFTGKSGKEWKLLIKDDDLSMLIRESRKMGGKGKGEDLFSYMDESGKYFDIKAEHINNYLEKHMQHRYTAKDFRTWAASWKTAARLAMVSEVNEKQMNELVEEHTKAEERAEKTGFPSYLSWMGRTLKGTEGLAKLADMKKLPGETDKERNATMLAVIDTVAADLGNTRAVCKSSYIRPMFMNDWENGIFMERWGNAKDGKFRGDELSDDETTAINYMRNHEDEEFDFMN